MFSPESALFDRDSESPYMALNLLINSSAAPLDSTTRARSTGLEALDQPYGATSLHFAVGTLVL
eukprot:4738849-Pyramimonas_sp.AAC.1